MEQGGNGPTCPEPCASSLPPRFPAMATATRATSRPDGPTEGVPSDELFTESTAWPWNREEAGDEIDRPLRQRGAELLDDILRALGKLISCPRFINSRRFPLAWRPERLTQAPGPRGESPSPMGKWAQEVAMIPSRVN